MSSIAIITARGGSKRIPGKNIKDFCGQPIIAYSIKAALESGIFDTVMVSTDDREIADISLKYGAEIPFMRSDATADDHATTADVLSEVLNRYHELGTDYEYGCCIYPTAPFIRASRLCEAYDMLRDDAGIDTVFTVAPYEIHPHRALSIVEGWVSPAFPDEYWKRTQDLGEMYHDCGQFYFFRVSGFMKSLCLETNAAPIILSPMENQDIDNETDWKMAELKFELNSKGEY